jgi:DNA-binding NarL/FixJ family response regulator
LLAEFGHEVVEAHGDAERILDSIVEHEPDLSILDVRMPPTFTDEGLRVAVRIRERRPNTPILMLSQYVEERYARELVASGAEGLGYLLKERVADVREFVEAAERVAGGGSAFDPEVIQQVMSRSRALSGLDSLTPRERDVLALVAEGRTNGAIAKAIFVSDGAVEKHITSIFMKLGLAPNQVEHRRVKAVLAFLQNS